MRESHESLDDVYRNVMKYMDTVAGKTFEDACELVQEAVVAIDADVGGIRNMKFATIVNVPLYVFQFLDIAGHVEQWGTSTYARKLFAILFLLARLSEMTPYSVELETGFKVGWANERSVGRRVVVRNISFEWIKRKIVAPVTDRFVSFVGTAKVVSEPILDFSKTQVDVIDALPLCIKSLFDDVHVTMTMFEYDLVLAVISDIAERINSQIAMHSSRTVARIQYSEVPRRLNVVFHIANIFAYGQAPNLAVKNLVMDLQDQVLTLPPDMRHVYARTIEKIGHTPEGAIFRSIPPHIVKDARTFIKVPLVRSFRFKQVSMDDPSTIEVEPFYAWMM